jgi:hypothetical protein
VYQVTYQQVVDMALEQKTLDLALSDIFIENYENSYAAVIAAAEAGETELPINLELQADYDQLSPVNLVQHIATLKAYYRETMVDLLNGIGVYSPRTVKLAVKGGAVEVTEAPLGVLVEITDLDEGLPSQRPAVLVAA